MQAFKDTGKAPVETEVAIHRIRITLTSRNVKSLEKGNKAPIDSCWEWNTDVSYEDNLSSDKSWRLEIRYSEPCH